MKRNVQIIIGFFLCLHSHSAGFTDLPKELRLLVLLNAPAKDILNFCLTSTEMLKLCNDEASLWQKLIERDIGSEMLKFGPTGTAQTKDLRAAYLKAMGNTLTVRNNTTEDMEIQLRINFSHGYTTYSPTSKYLDKKEPAIFVQTFKIKADGGFALTISKDKMEEINKSTDISESHPLSIMIMQVTRRSEFHYTETEINAYAFKNIKEFRQFIATNEFKVKDL